MDRLESLGDRTQMHRPEVLNCVYVVIHGADVPPPVLINGE